MALRSGTVILSAGFLGLAALVSGCAQSQESSVDTYEICRDNEKEIRVDDSQCPPGGGSSGRHSWVYSSGHAPAVGHPVPSGTYSTVRTGIVGRAGISGAKAGTSSGS